MVNVASHHGSAAGGTLFWWRGRLDFCGLDLEKKLGAFYAEPDCQRVGNPGAVNAFAIDEDAVAAVQIANLPLAVFENYFGMDAAYVVVLDAEFAVVGAADAEGVGELETFLPGWPQAYS